MKMVLLILWYMFILGIAIASIPFILFCFPVWQLITVWPFVVSFFASVAIALIGFSIPEYLLEKVGEGDSDKKL